MDWKGRRQSDNVEDRRSILGNSWFAQSPLSGIPDFTLQPEVKGYGEPAGKILPYSNPEQEFLADYWANGGMGQFSTGHQPQQKFLNFFPEPTPLISDENASTRTAKYMFALGEDAPTPDVLKSDIMNGREGPLREAVASKAQIKRDQERFAMVQDILKTSGDTGLTDSQKQFIESLSFSQYEDPNTVIEKRYGDKVLSELYFTDPSMDSLYTRASEEDPVAASTIYDVASENIAKMEVARKMFEDIEGEFAKESWISRANDFVETLIPFQSWANLSDAEGFEFLDANMRKQIQDLWMLPTDEFYSTLKTRVDEIARYNRNDAMAFLEAVLSYSASDQFFDNFNSVLELSIFLPGVKSPIMKAGSQLTKAAGRVGRAAAVDIAKTTPTALKDMTNAAKGTILSLAKKKGPDVPEVLATSGKIDEAVTTQLIKEIKFKEQAETILAGSDKQTVEQFRTVSAHIPSFMDPFTVGRGGYKLARDQAERVLDKVQTTTLKAIESIVNKQSLERLSDAALVQAINLATDLVKKEFPSASNAIADVKHIAAETKISNTHSVGFVFRKPNGDLFTSRSQASHFAREEFRLKDYTIEQQGNGYYLQVVRDLDETAPSVRDVLIETGNTTPQSLWNTWLGTVRSAEDLLPVSNRAARKTMVHGTQELVRLAKEMARPVGDLGKKSKQNLNRFLELNRDKIKYDMDGNPLRGEFYESIGDFEDAWLQAFNKLPTEKETSAYFSFVRFYQWDYMLRNFGIYRAKARQGISEFSLRIPIPDKAEIYTKPFEGKFVDQSVLEKASDDANILVWEPSGAEKQIYTSLGNLKGKKKEAFDALFTKGGYRVIQVANPYARPLLEETSLQGHKGIVNFVVTREFKNQRLSPVQIPYKPGGHVAYDYGWYIKQPKLQFMGQNKRMYFGDTTLRPVETEEKARRFSARYEEARKLYNNYANLKASKKKSSNALKELRDYVSKNLPETPDEFIEHFTKGRLDPTQPILTVRRGMRSINESSYKAQLGKYEDATQASDNLTRDVTLEYAGERNLDLDVIGEGSEQNPLIKLESPRLIDPLTTMQRSVSNLIRQQFLDDYRTLSVEHFVEEFWDVTNKTKEQLRNNPMEFFYKPSWNEQTTNPDKLKAAKNYQRAVQDLLGVRTQTQKNIARIKQRLYETTFDKLGEKTADFLDEKFLTRIGDPIGASRAAVFNMKLGLFAVPQLFRQAQTVTHVMAIAGLKIGLQGGIAYTPMRMAMMNEAWLDHMAKSISKMPGTGWTEETFKEAFYALKKSGIMNVEGEHIWKDDFADPKIFKGAVGSFLDKGQFFFREGERVSRVTAFNAAYLEWRLANPKATLNRKALSSIMLRQDTLNVNMTHASRAAWQKGAFSVPTQFLSYQIRLWEQMASKRLTKTEKARALLTYSAMYGIPVGVGGLGLSYLPLPIWPWYEDYRQALLENGIDYNNNIIAEGLHTGITGLVTHLLTGEPTDANEQLGPSGLSIIKDIFTADDTASAILLGAVGSTFTDLFSSVAPVLQDVKMIFTEGLDQGMLTATTADVVDVLRNVSSFNYGHKLVAGVSIGRLVTKGEIRLDDVNTMESILAGVLGVNPRDLADINVLMEMEKEYDKAKARYDKEVIKYLRRGLSAETKEERLAFFKLAKLWYNIGDGRPEDYYSLVKRAAKGYEDLFDAYNYKMMLEKVPQSQRGARYDAYIAKKKAE